METDAKQRGILSILVLLGVMIFLLGGSLTGYIDLQQFAASSESTDRPEFNPEYLYARALQLYETNDRPMARDIARRVTHLKPAHKDAHKLLAAIAMRDQDYPTALAECRRLVEIDPVDMTGQLGVGTALRRMGDRKKADEVFRGVLTSPYSNEKQREEAHFNLAQLNSPKEEEQGTSQP